MSFPTVRTTGLALSFLLLLLLGCSDSPDAASKAAAPAAEPAKASAQTASTQAEPTSTKPKRRRRERPLPAFEGTTLESERLSVASMLGRRFLVFFFNPEVRNAAAAADAVGRIAKAADDHNFAVLSVAQGSSADTTRSFVAKHGLPNPVLLDGSGAFAGRVGLREPVALAMVDAEGYVVNATLPPEGGADPTALLEETLRDWLRLPSEGEDESFALAERPEAPTFRAARLEGGTFDFETKRGEPVVLVFFLHTCPHCHHALRSIRKSLDQMAEETRPEVIGISVMNRSEAVKDALAREGLDWFPVLLDPDNAVAEAYGATGGVPVIYMIDAEGRIASRTQGWRDERDPPLMRMRLAKLAGTPVPMLLHASGYSGNEFCGVCHETQAATWELTSHANAFDTLVRHGAERKEDCVGCHVVGYEQAGGYELARPEPLLEDVGCETCHGRGGPHQSPSHVVDGDYAPVCGTCHTPEHSLGFDYATFVPRVSHAAQAALAALSPEERKRVLEERAASRTLLPSQADYVGSAACQSCHAAEYETWSSHEHGRALETLVAKGEAGNADCLACHTTAFGKEGGFAAGGTAADHPGFDAVGCETCHGPGSDHVADGAKRLGTIVSLGDKCDSCVILKICGSCHDDANDPGFEYEVLDKIEHQRHGTIEAGTGRPLGTGDSALRRPLHAAPESAALAALDRALAVTPEADPAARLP